MFLLHFNFLVICTAIKVKWPGSAFHAAQEQRVKATHSLILVEVGRRCHVAIACYNACYIFLFTFCYSALLCEINLYVYRPFLTSLTKFQRRSHQRSEVRPITAECPLHCPAANVYMLSRGLMKLPKKRRTERSALSNWFPASRQQRKAPVSLRADSRAVTTGSRRHAPGCPRLYDVYRGLAHQATSIDRPTDHNDPKTYCSAWHKTNVVNQDQQPQTELYRNIQRGAASQSRQCHSPNSLKPSMPQDIDGIRKHRLSPYT